MVGYNFTSFQGWPTNLYPNESHVLPFKNIISFFLFGQFLHTLKSLRVHLGNLHPNESSFSGNNSTLYIVKK